MVNVWLDSLGTGCWRHPKHSGGSFPGVRGAPLMVFEGSGYVRSNINKPRRIISTVTNNSQIAPTWAGRSTHTMQFCETLLWCPLLRSSLLFACLLKSTVLSILWTPFSLLSSLLFSSPFYEYSSLLCPTPHYSHSSLQCSHVDPSSLSLDFLLVRDTESRPLNFFWTWHGPDIEFALATHLLYGCS